MIDPELVKHRRPKIVNRGDVLHGPVSELIRGTVGDTALEPASREPGGEAVGIVIASIGAL